MGHARWVHGLGSSRPFFWGYITINLEGVEGSDGRELRMLWQVKGQDFWVECTVSNIDYLIKLLQVSPAYEKPPKAAKPSPKRRRRLKRRSSEEPVAEAPQGDVDAAQEAK